MSKSQKRGLWSQSKRYGKVRCRNGGPLGGQHSLVPVLVGGDSGDTVMRNGVRVSMSGESLASPPSKLRSGQARTSRAVGGNPVPGRRSGPDTTGHEKAPVCGTERACRGILGGNGRRGSGDLRGSSGGRHALG